MTEPARPGRWRSGAESRRRILDAARDAFAERGYGATTVRAVATAAEVDPAMVFYFFGTKQGLFAAATELPDHLPPAFDALFTGGLNGLGERLIRTLVTNLDASGRPPLGLLAASPQDRSVALLREFLDRELTARLAGLLTAPDAPWRAGAVNVQLLGLAVARYLTRIEPMASASADELVAHFAPIVDHCLTGG